MFAHRRAKSAACAGWHRRPRANRICTAIGASTLGLLTAACASTQERLYVGNDPADADARVPAAAYRPVTDGYVSGRPVEPAPWREQNERVMPRPRR